MSYYGAQFNYPFTSGYAMPMPYTQQTRYLQTPPTTNPQTTSAEKQNNNNLLWGALSTLAIVGTYLITKGHYKGKIPVGTATQSVEQAAARIAHEAKPVPEAVTTFVNNFKPFNGINGIAGEVKPTITQVGSRTRVDFDVIVGGNRIKETLIFNAESKPVSRFVQTTDKDGKVVREAFRINDKGEVSEAIQRSTRSRIAANPEKNTQRYEHKEIENLTVNQPPNDLPDDSVDAASNIRTLFFDRCYDDKTGRLINTATSRSYINSEGKPVYGVFRNERTFGYDANGNLTAIIERNPKQLFGDNSIVYRNLQNGEVRNLALQDQTALLRSFDSLENPVTSQEREFFRNFRYSSYPQEVRQHIETIRPQGFENVTPQIRLVPNQPGRADKRNVQLRYATVVDGKPRKVVIELKDGRPSMQYELSNGQYIERNLQNGTENSFTTRPASWFERDGAMYNL